MQDLRKQDGYVFKPDYTNNNITLTSVFFSATHNGKVNLTFHFRSGKTVTYTISIKGTHVTGTP